MKTNKKQKRIRSLIISLSIIIVLLASMLIYFGIYYHSESTNDYLTSNEEITVIQNKNYLIFEPKEIKAGLIFYPGAKVEYTSYAPLMYKLAEEGILTSIINMPLNFAFLKINGADLIRNAYPDVSNWYLAGHSLGGVVASTYLAKHLDEYQGMIYLASYSTKDFSNTSLKILSIYGSNDLVLNQKEYQNSLKNYPSSFEEHVIEGGCHAYFGDYGQQKGDGNPTITREEQQEETIKYMSNFILN